MSVGWIWPAAGMLAASAAQRETNFERELSPPK